MCKMVAVLREPKSCEFCEFGKLTICGAMYNYMVDKKPSKEYERYNIMRYKFSNARPDWCPLKPLPQKRAYANCHYDDDYHWAEGWNDCIEMILGNSQNNFAR